MRLSKRIAIFFISVLCLSMLSLTGCSSEPDSKGKSAIEVDESENNEEGESSALELIDNVSKKAKSTKALYVTDKLKVGEKGDVNPGIYDLEILGGSGNIMGDRDDFLAGMNINWVGSAKDKESPSVIRILLFDGDTLELSNISKVKFKAVSKPKKMTNKIGQGNYVVGRDIKAGTYKLSTNGKMDKQFENLGWSIGIYNFDTDEERDQSYNPENNDVVVKLEDGEVLTTSFDNTDFNSDVDKTKLIFTPVK